MLDHDEDDGRLTTALNRESCSYDTFFKRLPFGIRRKDAERQAETARPRKGGHSPFWMRNRVGEIAQFRELQSQTVLEEGPEGPPLDGTAP